MKRLFVTVTMLAAAVSLFAGDAAAFVDLGFSRDGKTYIFGQYGKTDVEFNGYAEIYTVDVRKNDFVPTGVFKTVDRDGKSGNEVFSGLKMQHKGFLDKYKPAPVGEKSMLYLREDSSKGSAEEIVFKDFEGSTPSADVFYSIRLVPMYEGRGGATKSSFYIVAEKKSGDGRVLSRFVAGNPDVQRKGVTGYAIDRIYTSPDGAGMVFVVEKTVEDHCGVSIRYMVETVALPTSLAAITPEPVVEK